MLFNSVEFLFAFLPLTAIGYYLVAARSVRAALYFLTCASLFFYAWWRPLNIVIIAPSILVNFALCRVIDAAREGNPRRAGLAFWAGIVFNVAYLGYFKYFGFLESVVQDATGWRFAIDRVILPLGLSFITFQKIALLADVRAGRVKRFSLREYFTFVLFFPPLISGPIVHYRELMPQFAAFDGRLRWSDIGLGITLFSVGLAKKLVIADPIAAMIAPTWHDAALGTGPALLQAWAAALGFTLQLYFDFSGYSDMAIGAARLFGVKLPPNFDSPLRCTSIVDFWTRWHMTLTRFLTAYVFSPMALARTRARVARQATTLGGRKTRPDAFIALMAIPTLQTMFLAGIWHGAGYTFVIFGILHGVALVINHAWRTWKPAWWPKQGSWLTRRGAWLLTIGFILFANVVFRAPDLATAGRVAVGMLGQHGLTLPSAVLARLGGPLAALGLAAHPDYQGGSQFVSLWAALAAGWLIVLVLPNIYALTAPLEPALGWKPKRKGFAFHFQPSRGWAFAISFATVAGLISLGRVSEFLYWQF